MTKRDPQEPENKDRIEDALEEARVHSVCDMFRRHGFEQSAKELLGIMRKKRRAQDNQGKSDMPDKKQ